MLGSSSQGVSLPGMRTDSIILPGVGPSTGTSEALYRTHHLFTASTESSQSLETPTATASRRPPTRHRNFTSESRGEEQNQVLCVTALCEDCAGDRVEGQGAASAWEVSPCPSPVCGSSDNRHTFSSFPSLGFILLLVFQACGTLMEHRHTQPVLCQS